MPIEVDHHAFRTAVGDIRASVDELRATRDGIHRDVEALLDRGWTGVAATSFADGWEEWRAGSDAVLDALTTIGRLLVAVHADLTERDLESATHLDRVGSQLAVRLGS